MVQVGDKVQGGFWDGFEVISVYSRAQAIEDGELVDVSDIATRQGFRIPVALTRSVWWEVQEAARKASLCPALMAETLLHGLYNLIRKLPGATDRFDAQVSLGGHALKVYAVVGPGDTPEPVITIMEPGED